MFLPMLFSKAQWRDFLIGFLSIALFIALWSLQTMPEKMWANRRRSHAADTSSENERDLCRRERGLAGMIGLFIELAVGDEAREDMEWAVFVLVDGCERL